jgi:hypothetical protein
VVDVHHGVQEGGVDLVHCAFVLETVVVGGGSWEEEEDKNAWRVS